MDEEEIPTVLKAPGFCDKAFSVLYSLQKSQQLCDLILQVKDGQVRVHSLVLVSSSSFFRQWVLDQKNNSALTFVMSDISMNELRDFVEFFYTGQLQLTSSKTEKTMSLYEKFKVQDAVRLCKIFVDGEGSVSQENLVNGKSHSDWSEVLKCEMKTSELTDNCSSVCLVKEESSLSMDIDSVESSNIHDETVCSKCKKKMPSKCRKGLRPRKTFTVLKVKGDCSPKKKTKIKIELNPEFADGSDTVTSDQKVDISPHVYNDIDDSYNTDHNLNAECLDQSSQVIDCNRNDDVMPVQTTTVRSLRKRSVLVKAKDYSQTKENEEEKETVHLTEVKSPVKTTRVRGTKNSGKKRVNRHLYACDICQYTSKSRRDIDGHKHSKHDIAFDTTRYTVYKCQVEDCNYETLETARLDKHMAYRHSDERPYVCEFCARAFKTLPELKLHLNLHLNDKLKCKECDKKFVSPSGLKKHTEEKHLGIKDENMCHLCAYRTTTGLNTLTQHMYTKHNVPLPNNFRVFKCDKCDFETFRARVFTSHQNMHTGTRDWQCDICHKKYTTEHNLKCHKLWHDEKKFVCTYEGCNYSAIQKSRLQEHVKRMHTEKDVKPYSCHLCPHKSKIAGNLDKHLRSVHNLHIPDKRKYSHLYNLGRNLSNQEDKSSDRTNKDQQSSENEQNNSADNTVMQEESKVCTEQDGGESVDQRNKSTTGEQVENVEKNKDSMFTNMASANPPLLLEGYQNSVTHSNQGSAQPLGMSVFPVSQPYRSVDSVSFVLQDQSYGGQQPDTYSVQDSLNFAMDSYH